MEISIINHSVDEWPLIIINFIMLHICIFGARITTTEKHEAELKSISVMPAPQSIVNYSEAAVAIKHQRSSTSRIEAEFRN